MKSYKGEYTIKIKVSDINLPNDHTEGELKGQIKDKARSSIVAYLSGYLFDPSGKVIEENISFEEIKK